MLSMYVSLFCETTYLSEHESSPECHTYYIPVFYFKLHPKFPFLFHTPMFLMSSYSILRCFPILHSNVSHSLLTFFHTPMFSLLQHFRNPPVPFHAPTFSHISHIFRCFPHFYRCRTFLELLWAHYHHGTFSVTSRTLFPKHHNLRRIMDSLWMQ